MNNEKRGERETDDSANKRLSAISLLDPWLELPQNEERERAIEHNHSQQHPNTHPKVTQYLRIVESERGDHLCPLLDGTGLSSKKKKNVRGS